MSLICFDLDGTLCKIDHRLGWVKSNPKNWAAFEAGIAHDSVNVPVAQVFHALHTANNILIFASGRSESARPATVEWLRRHKMWFGDYSRLYMRKAGDYRSDDIVKNEIIDQIQEDFGRLPDMWFDDRPRVVRAVRARGIFVFDVYQGEEDF
jgi:hydroxymethylpyrimidine pyrophosphatase-like HAD family hydrolase